MHSTRLRKVGGSVMLAVPPVLLDLLNLKVGTAVELAVDGGRLVVEVSPKPRYTLAELLAASDYSGQAAELDEDWVGGQPVGGELI
ncbi:antitoxin [Phenylobacterium sp.]|uniref:AbrB/MazE/SpoVT family DNA-binding domain-containing protein n=1 Tax=Phenylobacterium sp. TaxID=1871053 RepID=UPI00286EB2FA|nr:antitoxin [Phenylobacterium sp.]